MDLTTLNPQQYEAVVNNTGPMLVIAGPGTGKTFTLVKKIAYLLIVKNVSPEAIMITTFTNKAANELKLRIAEELKRNNFPLDINRINIGTIHSLCQKIISDEKFILLDDTDQRYLIHQNLGEFSKLKGYNSLISSFRLQGKSPVGEFFTYFSKFSESQITPDILYHNENSQIQTLGVLYSRYLDILNQNSIYDFSKILTECKKILKSNLNLLHKYQKNIEYILIDEFQDTNLLQLDILFMISGDKKNICVVGDDDQAIYRFRGASTKNILNFPNHFKDVQCKVIKLQTNYRSKKNIIQFYMDFMKRNEWGKNRFEKLLLPCSENDSKIQSVFKITENENTINLYNRIADTLVQLKKDNIIEDFSQVAFLFKSVKSLEAKYLAEHLNKVRNIKVYSPRSGAFFEKNEIKFILGSIIKNYSNYYLKLSSLSQKNVVQNKLFDMTKLTSEKERDLEAFIGEIDFEENSPFLPEFFKFFKSSYLQKIFSKDSIHDKDKEIISRNISILANIIEKYEEKNGSILNEDFFEEYLPFLFEIGINEYEDNSDISAPGHVSFLTFHQSKGLEFPIVFIGNLHSTPDRLLPGTFKNMVEEKIFKISNEENNTNSIYDFYRLFFTAFSRAKNINFLICSPGEKSSPSAYFKEILPSIPELPKNFSGIQQEKFSISKQKKSYSFSEYTLYSQCPRKYRFLKDLNFPTLYTKKEMLGILIHDTINNLYNAKEQLDDSLIKSALRQNYDFLKKKLNLSLTSDEAKEAYRMVLNYTQKNNMNISSIFATEMPLSNLRSEYVLQGVLDLVIKYDEMFEVIDFKTSEIKPECPPENYYEQLLIYAYLMEENGYPVNNLKLYYTGENSNEFFNFNADSKKISKLLKNFDSTVENIESKIFFDKTKFPFLCKECQFRWYCDSFLF